MGLIYCQEEGGTGHLRSDGGEQARVWIQESPSGHHHLAALTDRFRRSAPYFLAYFRADDGLGVVLILGSVGVGDVGVKPVPEEFLNCCDGTISSICRIPHISPSFHVALAGFVGAGERPLVMLINNLCLFYHHTHRPELNLIVVRHHVV